MGARAVVVAQVACASDDGGVPHSYRLGRFLSVDPIISNPADSQSINPYSYIGNNPLSGVDPTGYCIQITGSHVCQSMTTYEAAKQAYVNLGTTITWVNFPTSSGPKGQPTESAARPAADTQAIGEKSPQNGATAGAPMASLDTALQLRQMYGAAQPFIQGIVITNPALWPAAPFIETADVVVGLAIQIYVMAESLPPPAASAASIPDADVRSAPANAGNASASGSNQGQPNEGPPKDDGGGDGGGRGSKQFRGPDPNAQGPHSRFRTDDKGVTHYETYDHPSPGQGKRVDVTGPSHGEVPTPHVVETTKHVNPQDPSQFRFIESRPRPAMPNEIPKRLP
jgi:hypothetical protein